MKQATLFLLIVFFIAGCQPEKKNIAIYAIGDSTMANKKEEVHPETGWCQVVDQYFNESVTVKNHAVNGRSSKSFIDEGRWQQVLDSLEKGDYVFIQFGHNDQKDNDSTRYTAPYGTYKANLERFIKESKEKEAVPVLFTPIVRRKFGDDGLLKNTHGKYPEVVRVVAEQQDVELIDLQKLTEEWVNNMGEEKSTEMFLWTPPDEKFPAGRKDDTHLSEQGAKKVASIAMEECRRQNLAFTKHLKNDY